MTETQITAMRLSTGGSRRLFATEYRHRLRFSSAVFRVVLERFGIDSDADELGEEVFFITLIPPRFFSDLPPIF